MTQNPAYQWAARRGDKWCRHLSLMEATLDPVDPPLLQALQVQAPCRVADIGCGGGGTSLKLLQQAPAGCVIHGYDLSAPLVQVAQGRAQHDELRFHHADVSQALPQEAGYDRLLSRFGVMFFSDPPRAFARLLRWLAPGGRFAFAVWGPPRENPWATVVRQAVAQEIELPPSPPDTPGPFRYADADSFQHLLRQAGFARLELTPWRGKLPIGGGLGAAEAAYFGLSSFSSFQELLEPHEGAFDRAHQRLTQALEPFAPEGAVWMDACAWVITGHRPE